MNSIDARLIRLSERRATERNPTMRDGLAAACCEVCSQRCKTVWDHCHRTGKFRGWLCSPCNTALGMVYDNPATLRALADYLDNKIEESEDLAEAA
jgi:hypothetical protein